MIIICVNILYFKSIVTFPMCELQYMFAADLFPVFCLNMMLQGKGGGAVHIRHGLKILGCSMATICRIRSAS